MGDADMDVDRMRIESEIVESGYAIIYRNSITGRVDFRLKTCRIPRIRSRKSLYIALHELGHIANGYIKPKYVGEYLAEKYAHKRMREMGYRVPRSMTDRAKRYIRHKIMMAWDRGLRTIDPGIREWSGLLSINS